jgi:hypothetical protein
MSERGDIRFQAVRLCCLAIACTVVLSGCFFFERAEDYGPRLKIENKTTLSAHIVYANRGTEICGGSASRRDEGICQPVQRWGWTVS